ncbi:UvrD-helicase domain-containing protein [Streptomyces sp. NPDC048442]|uniref:UvrD-helicase domain-containing protein n=1 Tax=Streptomyces sp. NPDC048442 TaxID=3154823 RepID=UPI0034220E21
MTAKKARPSTDSSPEAEDSVQEVLFTGRAPRPRRPRREATTALTPVQELSRHLSAIVRLTGQSYGEINLRLNRRLGVTTRVGASPGLVQQAIELALEYRRMLERPAPPGETARAGGQSAVAASRPGGERTRPAPTAEQERAIETKRSGGHMVLQAGAGTGKTTTLRMLAETDLRRGLFLAFNRSVVDDAARRFPPHMDCRTGHSLAMRALGPLYGHRLNAPREPGWKEGVRLGIGPHMVLQLGERKVSNRALSYTVLRTVDRFCHSDAEEIRSYHVPRLRGASDDELHAQLVHAVLPYARRAWDDIQNPDGTKLRFKQDHALKIWALQKPRIAADFILLDEAQDTNPVIEEVFLAQRDHAQLIMVGDSAQAIYGWRGARDVMTGFNGQQLALSQSFRFGPALADEANRWLALVDSPIRLTGNPALDTSIGPLENTNAVLCRTNIGAITEIFDLLEKKKKVALAGDGKALESLAQAAGNLKAGRRANHPELFLFETWADLQEYATYDPAGTDLLALVDIIDEYGAETILDAVRRLDNEDKAEVVVSTAHKAKGREWPSVRIAADFEPTPTGEKDDDGNPLPPRLNIDESRLAYVAVTRARQHLDLGGLSWINNHPGGRPSSPAPLPGPALPSPPHDSPWSRLGPTPT